MTTVHTYFIKYLQLPTTIPSLTSQTITDDRKREDKHKRPHTNIDKYEHVNSVHKATAMRTGICKCLIKIDIQYQVQAVQIW